MKKSRFKVDGLTTLEKCVELTGFLGGLVDLFLIKIDLRFEIG